MRSPWIYALALARTPYQANRIRGTECREFCGRPNRLGHGATIDAPETEPFEERRRGRRQQPQGRHPEGPRLLRQSFDDLPPESPRLNRRHHDDRAQQRVTAMNFEPAVADRLSVRGETPEPAPGRGEVGGRQPGVSEDPAEGDEIPFRNRDAVKDGADPSPSP